LPNQANQSSFTAGRLWWPKCTITRRVLFASARAKIRTILCLQQTGYIILSGWIDWSSLSSRLPSMWIISSLSPVLVGLADDAVCTLAAGASIKSDPSNRIPHPLILSAHQRLTHPSIQIPHHTLEVHCPNSCCNDWRIRKNVVYSKSPLLEYGIRQYGICNGGASLKLLFRRSKNLEDEFFIGNHRSLSMESGKTEFLMKVHCQMLETAFAWIVDLPIRNLGWRCIVRIAVATIWQSMNPKECSLVEITVAWV